MYYVGGGEGIEQTVERYENSRYGTLRTWAQELGLDDAASLRQKTLDEEEPTDKALSQMAKTADKSGSGKSDLVSNFCTPEAGGPNRGKARYGWYASRSRDRRQR